VVELIKNTSSFRPKVKLCPGTSWFREIETRVNSLLLNHESLIRFGFFLGILALMAV
jgi:hypothetical protein